MLPFSFLTASLVLNECLHRKKWVSTTSSAKTFFNWSAIILSFCVENISVIGELELENQKVLW